MIGAKVIALQPSSGRRRLVFIAICYVAGLLFIANLAFGTSMFFGASTGPARTGTYNTRVPIVAPLDPDMIPEAIIEAAGDQPATGATTIGATTTSEPTIGQPLTVDVLTAGKRAIAGQVRNGQHASELTVDRNKHQQSVPLVESSLEDVS